MCAPLHMIDQLLNKIDGILLFFSLFFKFKKNRDQVQISPPPPPTTTRKKQLREKKQKNLLLLMPIVFLPFFLLYTHSSPSFRDKGEENENIYAQRHIIFWFCCCCWGGFVIHVSRKSTTEKRNGAPWNDVPPAFKTILDIITHVYK